ncbi:MAG: LamG-like jellyroll fold domain-containing protein [Planctomycetota bacterium]
MLVSLLPGQQGHVHTDRTSSKLLPLPKSDDVFHFAIYGDRTGGPAAGIKVLAQAVKDTNLLDPDLVMTVGDMVQGYNNTREWLKQMREFQGVMNRLKMRWYPVAGNHDVYWRGKGKKPKGEHERSYERHFGPLWYAFEHKNCWFVVLFSDEGNQKTGEKTFRKPAAQRMSPAQLTWLRATLLKARGADHVFLFLHHPRWRKRNYGNDWDKVHTALVAVGNVTAVFAGHIHQMVYSGKRDGIEYYTLATTGGVLKKGMPERAGFLHHQNLVTVRKDRISVSTIPVGAVIDPKLLTEQVNRDMYAVLEQLKPTFPQPLVLGAGGAFDGLYAVEVRNPASASLELTLVCESKDPRFRFLPDHRHFQVDPLDTKKVMFHVHRAGTGIDSWFHPPRLVVRGDYLAKASGLRLALTERSFDIPVLPPVLGARPKDQRGGHLALLKKGAHLDLPAGRLALGAGPFTIEGFVLLPKVSGRRTLFSHAHGNGLEVYLDEGRPHFRIGSGKAAVKATAADGAAVKPGRWHHLAGVWDGAVAALYLDGKRIASAKGKRKAVAGSLRLGAGSGKKPRPVKFLGGLLDEVRLSGTARYRRGFQPPSRVEGFRVDSRTLLLLHLDQNMGPWVADRSRNGAHPLRMGKASCTPD